MGKLCVPILEMKQDKKVEYRLKHKNLDKFHQGTITITCSRFYNPVKGNIKLFKPMDQGYFSYEQKYTLATFFPIIDRLKVRLINEPSLNRLILYLGFRSARYQTCTESTARYYSLEK